MLTFTNSAAPVSKKSGEDPITPVMPAGSVCLFATYAPSGNLPDYTRFYIKNLQSCGFILHVILSGTNVITEDTLNFCVHSGIHISCRQNGGLDFGAWSFLTAQGVTKGAPYILLANDSVFGPFAPLPPLLQHLQANSRPAWGLVGSRAVTPHIQSWFIGFSQDVWESTAVQRVMALPFPDMSRQEIIWHGELGLSVALAANAIPLHTLWSDMTSPLARLFPANPTHAYWRSGLRSGNVPFLKQELLRDNPYHIPKLAEWRTLIPQHSSFDPTWIEEYLAHTPSRYKTLPSNRKGRMVYYALSQLDRYLPLSWGIKK